MAAHTYEILLALGVLSPLVSFWVLVLFGPKWRKPIPGIFALVMGMGIPLVLATIVLFGWLGAVESGRSAELTANALRWTWADMGDVPVTVGVKLDSLTVAMYFMVTFVAFWIFFFSIGYMSGHSDEVASKSKYHRFFAYLSLFGFSMLGLVVSSSLLFLFIFWELVGLCSYLLIGFYFDRAYASAAAIKAFVTNRVGDFGFLIGLMLVFFQLGTFDLDQAAANFAQQYAAGTGIFASHFTLFGWSLATIMGIGLFCGAMGKSAQFPLHVWLPDAMAGPTPVSALIHAATMVAAGVYLVARVFRLMTPDALMFVALIGCLTLTLMALVAIVQTDIKKCLAYSTLSQLGYMIFGMGVGAWVAALFHLITHAFFKAMLFLGSGQVIEGCHHEQDMRRMGGLRRKMPFTCWTFFVGVLAISGFGIAGLDIGGMKFGLGGFFSKDEIMAVAWARTFDWNSYDKHQEGDPGHGGHVSSEAHAGSALQVTDDPRGLKPAAQGTLLVADRHAADSSVDAPEGVHVADHGSDGHVDRAAIFAGTPKLPRWMFYLALITAYVTPFYMMRCWWMTFMGKPRDKHVHEHAHESPMMFIPLVVLAVGTGVASYFLFRPLIADAAGVETAAPLVLALSGEAHTQAIHHAHEWLKFGVGGAFLVGFIVAIAVYRRGLDFAENLRRLPGVSLIHLVLEKKYYFDEVYDFIWVKGCLLVSRIARFIDSYFVDLIFDTTARVTARLAHFSGMIIDAHGVDGVFNGISQTSLDIGGILRRPQTGRIRNYLLMTAGVTTAVVIGVLVFRMDWSSSAASAIGAAGQ